MKSHLLVAACCLAAIFSSSNCLAQGTDWNPDTIPVLSMQESADLQYFKGENGDVRLAINQFLPQQQSYSVQVPYQESVTETYVDQETGESRTRTKPITRMRLETRTRTVYRKTRTQVSTKDVKVWRIDGQVIPTEKFAEEFAKPKRCFVTRYQHFNFQSEPFFAKMFKDDVYVVWYANKKSTKTKRDEK